MAQALPSSSVIEADFPRRRMDRTLPDEPRGVPTDAPDPSAVPFLLGDAALQVERAADFDALERMLMTLATHPSGLDADRCWLLSAQPGGAGLRIDRVVERHEPAPDLREALRPQAARPGRVAGAPCILEHDRLEAPLARAWSQGVPSLGFGMQPGVAWHGMELGALALRRGLRPCALLIVAWEPARAPESRQERIALLQRWAQGAAGAIERGLEAQRRARQAAAQRELARATVSVLNLAEALRLTVRLATHALGARGSALWTGVGDQMLRLDATHGPSGTRDALARALEPAATEVLAAGRTRIVEPFANGDDPGAAFAGATLLTPIVAYGRTLGVLAAHGRAPLHPSYAPGFDAHDSACLEALADLAALAIHQAERFDRERADRQRREELVARVRRLERLATLGERAVRGAPDARNALATIAAFSRRMHRARPADDPDREYLEIVIREAARLERWLADAIDDAGAPPAALRVESLNAAIQEVLHDASETLVRRRVRLLKRLAPDLPPLLADAERTRRVLRDVLHHATERVANGGRIRVESRRAAQHVVVEIAHDGPRHPGDLLEQLFVPFDPGGAPGGGLHVAEQLVRRMGGEIRMRSEGEWSALVSVTLPIEGNQDRRGRGHDRRAGGRERRADARRA